jgi:adenylate kinase
MEAVASRIGGGMTIVFGTVMLEEGKRLGWIRHRDEIRKLSLEKQIRLQKVAATKISKTRGKVLLVDTHLFIRTPEGYWPGLPFDVIRALRPTHLVLVEASSEDILLRRNEDKTRYRDTTDAAELEFELSLARNLLSSASLVSGAPMLIVKNEQGKLDEAVEKVVRLVQGHSS